MSTFNFLKFIIDYGSNMQRLKRLHKWSDDMYMLAAKATLQVQKEVFLSVCPCLQTQFSIYHQLVSIKLKFCLMSEQRTRNFEVIAASSIFWLISFDKKEVKNLFNSLYFKFKKKLTSS